MASNMLPTSYQEFIHKSRYARWIEEEGRRENWNETVSRYVNFMEEALLEKHNYKMDKVDKEILSDDVDDYYDQMQHQKLKALIEADKIARVSNKDKDYLAVAKLGYKSTTGDAEGVITSTDTNISEKLNSASLNSMVTDFIGPQKQVPPMHSGLKINGVKLYKLARQGICVDRQAREINIYELKIISIVNDEITLKISCSKGTYIRTLIESIGDYLGVGAFTKELRRLKVGNFEEKNMISINDITNHQNSIIPLEDMIGDMDVISVTSLELKTLRFGQAVYTKKYKNTDEIAIKNSNCNLVGIGESMFGFYYNNVIYIYLMVIIFVFVVKYNEKKIINILKKNFEEIYFYDYINPSSGIGYKRNLAQGEAEMNIVLDNYYYSLTDYFINYKKTSFEAFKNVLVKDFDSHKSEIHFFNKYMTCLSGIITITCKLCNIFRT